jgi:DNA-directed RNA polymerase beta subunit
MECVSFQAHGASEITLQRFVDLSDKFDMFVCNKCGLFVDDIGWEIGFGFCRRCATETTVRKVKLTFIFAVLLYHLNSLGVATFLGLKDLENL